MDGSAQLAHSLHGSVPLSNLIPTCTQLEKCSCNLIPDTSVHLCFHTTCLKVHTHVSFQHVLPAIIQLPFPKMYQKLIFISFYFFEAEVHYVAHNGLKCCSPASASHSQVPGLQV